MIAWALRKLVSTNRSGPACCNTAFTHFLSPRLLRSGFGRLHTLFCTDLSPSQGLYLRSNLFEGVTRGTIASGLSALTYELYCISTHCLIFPLTPFRNLKQKKKIFFLNSFCEFLYEHRSLVHHP